MATDKRNPPPTRIRLGAKWLNKKSLQTRWKKLPNARAGGGRNTGSTAPVRARAYQMPRMAGTGTTANSRYRAEPPLNRERRAASKGPEPLPVACALPTRRRQPAGPNPGDRFSRDPSHRREKLVQSDLAIPP